MDFDEYEKKKRSAPIPELSQERIGELDAKFETMSDKEKRALARHVDERFYELVEKMKARERLSVTERIEAGDLHELELYMSRGFTKSEDVIVYERIMGKKVARDLVREL